MSFCSRKLFLQRDESGKTTASDRRVYGEKINVFEHHKRCNDFNCTSTVITQWDGEELPLGLIRITFAEIEHRISPHKHPHSGKQFIPMAPSTKAKLLKEASG